MKKKIEQSNNPTSGKKKYVKPIWFPDDLPTREDKISPTSKTREKPFSDKNINHKW